MSRWFADHATSPKTGARVRNRELIPNHAIRSAVQQHLEQEKASVQRVQKRFKFALDQVPQVTRLQLATLS